MEAKPIPASPQQTTTLSPNPLHDSQSLARSLTFLPSDRHQTKLATAQQQSEDWSSVHVLVSGVVEQCMKTY